jgi:hypothetical protein
MLGCNKFNIHLYNMFSNIFQKAALFGASTVAGVALTGTMMANSAQAATISYTSEFSVTSNRLNSEVATGSFSFTKTELTGEDSGLFGYKLEGFNISAIGQTLTLDGVKENPNPFLAVNQTFVPQKYQAILPSALADKDYNYKGDGDFPPPDFIREFSGEEFWAIADEYNLTSLISIVVPSVDTTTANGLLNGVFGEGGKVSLTTTSSQSNPDLASVPEPTTIFGLGVVGVGLVATRRKRATKKIKQKAAA